MIVWGVDRPGNAYVYSFRAGFCSCRSGGRIPASLNTCSLRLFGHQLCPQIGERHASPANCLFQEVGDRRVRFRPLEELGRPQHQPQGILPIADRVAAVSLGRPILVRRRRFLTTPPSSSGAGRSFTICSTLACTAFKSVANTRRGRGQRMTVAAPAALLVQQSAEFLEFLRAGSEILEQVMEERRGCFADRFPRTLPDSRPRRRSAELACRDRRCAPDPWPA